MKSYLAKKDEIQRKWWLVNAEGQTLGRLCSKISLVLRGKTKPEFTPNVDTGDFVIVINAEKIKISGKKTQQKIYFHHSRTPGGFKSENYEKLLQRRPEKIIENAVRRMLPSTTLGEKQFTKLKVYKGTAHPHNAQKPEKLELLNKKGK